MFLPGSIFLLTVRNILAEETVKYVYHRMLTRILTRMLTRRWEWRGEELKRDTEWLI